MDGAAELLGLLAEPDRLRVLAALVLGAGTTAEVAALAGVPATAVARSLARLEAGGLVTRGPERARWVLNAGRFKEAARATAPQAPAEDLGGDPQEAAVLRAFLRNGRLTTIPAQRGKRLVVLGHVARVFDVGVRYPEREVNALLRVFHEDVAALRRYLVDEGLLSRERGEYWRTGGPVS